MNNVSNEWIKFSFREEADIKIEEKKELILINEKKISWETEVQRLTLSDSKSLEMIQELQSQSIKNKENILKSEYFLFRKIAKENGFKQYHYFEQIQKIRSENQFGFKEAIAEFQNRQNKQILNYKQFLNFSEMKAITVIEYVNCFGLTPSIANRLVTILGTRFVYMTIQKIALFINLNKKNWQQKAKISNEPVYIKEKEVGGYLPRNLQYNPDGTIYCLFNKEAKRDYVVGKGSFKIAKLALNLENGECVARMTGWVNEKICIKEVEMTHRFEGYEGIVQIFPKTFFVYPPSEEENENQGKKVKMSYMSKYYNAGDLRKHLLRKKRYCLFHKKEKFFIAKRFLSGLHQIHQKGVLHRDLKDRNLLLHRDLMTEEIIDCVIGDFGFACDRNDKVARSSCPGTYNTMAPEYLLARLCGRGARKANDFAIDNWGAGVILYQIFKEDILEWALLPKDPKWFDHHTVKELNEDLQNLKDDWLPRPQQVRSIGHVICDLLQPNPKKRLSAYEALSRLEASKEAYTSFLEAADHVFEEEKILSTM